MCKRHDNTNRSSEFICLRCLSKNQVGDKIRRPNMREKDHVKNLCCLCTKLQMRTKNLEVRWCDDFDERRDCDNGFDAYVDEVKGVVNE